MAKRETSLTTVPALVLTPEVTPVIEGNFDQIKWYLTKRQEEVLAMDFSEDNMTQIRLVKKELVTYRNSLDKFCKEYKKAHFNDPKTAFDGKVSDLFAVIASMEGAADNVLDREEKQRVADLTDVFDMYKVSFQGEYQLDPSYLSKIEYKKEYYNKTAVEKDTKNDIEAQFSFWKRQQVADEASTRLITRLCDDEPRLNIQHWLDKLATEDVATIQEHIGLEKARLAALDQQITEQPEVTETATQAAVLPEKVVLPEETTQPPSVLVLGAANTIDFASDFPGRKKTLRIEVEYPCDLGDALTELFDQLTQYGICIRPLEMAVA